MASTLSESATPTMDARKTSIVVRFNPTDLTTEKYDESVKRIKQAGAWPPDGMEFHVLFGSEGSLHVSEVWASRAQLDAFGERLLPILKDVGIEFTGEPEVFEVHELIKG
jgi:hypothetical protein